MHDTIQKAKEGSPAAREALVAALRSRVRRACRRYASFVTHVEPQDLEQEMWYGVFAALPEVDLSIGDPSEFLLQRGRFALLDSLKKRRQEPLPPEEFEDAPDRENVERNVLAQQAVRDLIQNLGEQQQLIVHYLLADFTRAEIARILECTPANMTYHVGRIGDAYSRGARWGDRQIALCEPLHGPTSARHRTPASP